MVRPSRFGLLLCALAAAALGLSLWLVSAARTLRSEARDRFFEQYNRQQLLVAQNAARGIEAIFGGFRRTLSLTADLFRDREVTAATAGQVRESLTAMYGVLAEAPIIDLVLFDRAGTVVGIVPDEPGTLGQNYSWRDYYQWARDRGRPGQLYLSPFTRLAGGQHRGDMAVIVAMGIYDPGGRFKGVAMATVNFDELARRSILSVRMGEHGYAWLLDSLHGTILVDPRGKITGQHFAEAFLPRWPKLHALAEATRSGRPATDWYDFVDPRDPARAVRKLVGHAPVRLEGALWTLGVCTPTDEVEALFASFLGRQQTFFETLIATTLAAAAVFLGLLLTWNRILSAEVQARARDLDEARSRLESAFEELLAARKMAAVGHLALGLAHEIRNPLSSIRMNVQMLRRRLPAEGPSAENFAILEEEIQRLNRLLTDVMSFARPPALRLVDARLPEVARRALVLLAPRLEGAGITCRSEWPAGFPVVRCDAELVHQALLNLLLNAVQALEGRPGRREVAVRGEAAGDFASVEVVDSGPGVAPEHRASLFDPFFTTKAQGGGLGLSIAQSIALRHGGTLEAGEAPGGGARFILRLPLAGPTPAETA